jgi:acetyl-CoA C-acetyltransferase
MDNKPDNSEAVILSAARTPSGRFQGSLSSIPAPKLGAIVVREAVERAGIQDPSLIEEVIMGNVIQAGLGQNPARQAAIFAGLPDSVGATTINKVCGSGLKTAMVAAQAVRAWSTPCCTTACGIPSKTGEWGMPLSSSPRNTK